MKQIIEPFLILIAFGTFVSLGLMWAINQWVDVTHFEITFWQSSSILLLIFIMTMLIVFIKNILNYQK
jgi:hypothetical protein